MKDRYPGPDSPLNQPLSLRYPNVGGRVSVSSTQGGEEIRGQVGGQVGTKGGRRQAGGASGVEDWLSWGVMCRDPGFECT